MKNKEEEWYDKYEEIKHVIYRLHWSGLTPKQLGAIVCADLVDILDLADRKDKNFLELWKVAVDQPREFDEHPFDVFLNAVFNEFDKPKVCSCCKQEIKE